MSDVIDSAVEALGSKLGSGFGSTAKFIIEGEGSIMLDASGARAGDEDADVTLTADADTFREILSGDLNPTSAFMGGRLKVDGDMSVAMQLGSALA